MTTYLQIPRAELIEAVKTWANCQDAEVSDAGGIWITGPQTGHWLNEAALKTFVDWLEKQ
jgi:hypothetical protein